MNSNPNNDTIRRPSTTTSEGSFSNTTHQTQVIRIQPTTSKTTDTTYSINESVE